MGAYASETIIPQIRQQQISSAADAAGVGRAIYFQVIPGQRRNKGGQQQQRHRSIPSALHTGIVLPRLPWRERLPTDSGGIHEKLGSRRPGGAIECRGGGRPLL